MVRRLALYALALILFPSANLCYGQTTVWLSDNATFEDLNITTAAAPGTTGSFDIWIKTEHGNRLIEIDLDLMAVGEAIEFTGAEIMIGQNRFRLQGNPMVMDDGATVTGIWAYAGIGGADLGTGLGPGVPVDDFRLGAYRFATVHYRNAAHGTSELQLKLGGLAFNWTLGGPNTIHLGIQDPVTENVPGASDTIIDGRIQVVPEPGSLPFLLISSWLLAIRRLRR